MVGLKENSQLLHSELIHPSAYHETTKLCAIYQISQLLGLDYEKLCDAFRPLFEAHCGTDEMTYTTPLMVADWAKANGHSCYFLKQNTVSYTHLTLPTKRIV